MNILHIATDFRWSNIFILPIAKHQASFGNKVWISTPNPPKQENKDGIYICSWSNKYSSPFKYFASAFVLIKKIRENNIDMVYAHTSLDSFIYIIFLKFFTNARVKYINHGVPFEGYSGILREIMKLIEMTNVFFAHEIITITKSMVPLLHKVNLLRKEIKFLIPGTLVGTELVYKTYHELLEQREKYKQNKVIILFVGRVEKRKGILELIDAVKETKLDCKLIILGEDKHELLKGVKHPRISFQRYQSNLSEFYLSSDYLCVPSHHEGFGQVYLEAASYGVIPICSNIPGPTDFILNNKNGFCVTPSNTQSIIDLFNNIHANKFDKSQIQEEAYMSSVLFDSRLVISKNLEVI